MGDLPTWLAVIAASWFAWQQNKINQRSQKIELALRYQNHYLSISTLLIKYLPLIKPELMMFKSKYRLSYSKGSNNLYSFIATNNNSDWKLFRNDYASVYYESQLFNDKNVKKINQSLFDKIINLEKEISNYRKPLHEFDLEIINDFLEIAEDKYHLELMNIYKKIIDNLYSS